MDVAKIKLAIQSKIICLVKYDMNMHNISEDEAYINVIQTELYKLLNDEETKLYLEPKEYVEEAYRLEVTQSPIEMYKFIALV